MITFGGAFLLLLAEAWLLGEDLARRAERRSAPRRGSPA